MTLSMADIKKACIWGTAVITFLASLISGGYQLKQYFENTLTNAINAQTVQFKAQYAKDLLDRRMVLEEQISEYRDINDAPAWLKFDLKITTNKEKALNQGNIYHE